MSKKIKGLLLIAFLAGGAMPFLLGGNAPTSLTTPYYYFMPPATTNALIKPPANIYTYSLLRAAGTDTISVWYFKNAADSVEYQIPPPKSGDTERVVSFTIGPPITSAFGIRVTSAATTGLVVSGGY